MEVIDEFSNTPIHLDNEEDKKKWIGG